MDDLFRFLILRAANLPGAGEVRPLVPSFVTPDTDAAEIDREVRTFSEGSGFVRNGSALRYGPLALRIASAIGGGVRTGQEVAGLVASVVPRTPADLVADAAFVEEERRVSDSLAAMKLASASLGGDAPELVRLAQGYDAIRQAAAGSDSVLLRTLRMDRYKRKPRPEASPGTNPVQPPSPPAPSFDELQEIEATLAALGTVPASAFERPVRAVAAPASTAAASFFSNRDTGSGAGQGAQPWIVSERTSAALPEVARKTLSGNGIDLKVSPLPSAILKLHARRTALLEARAQRDLPAAQKVNGVGVAFCTVQDSDYVGEPTAPFPIGHGNVRPVGVGDLLIVKQHALRYEGGDLAHVENVLKSEHLTRDTRRLQRTEVSMMHEMETTREEIRDTQSTERFSLKRETSDTISTDTSMKAGLSVDAKYGPFIEAKATAEAATSTATESSTRQATEFSKDVVARSVSRLVERILERRSTTTIDEFEEKYSHGFDNSKGEGHVSGFYQWLDKVSQAQVYNYGKRLMFDVTVPEPATNYIIGLAEAHSASEALEKPPEFTLAPHDLDEGNFTTWGQLYNATGLEPPPAPLKTVSHAIDLVVQQDPLSSSKSAVLPLEAGYRAKYALFAYDYWQRAEPPRKARFGVLIGSNWMEVITDPRLYLDMSGEIGSVPFAFEARRVENIAATIEIFCERTEGAYQSWQLKMHATITQAYLARRQAYDQALAQARAQAGVEITGHNPSFNQRIVSSELRRQCLTLLTGQQFDGFGALELSLEGYAQPNLARTDEQMAYVRFFEQAFEWDHLVYFFYPYFWGLKKGWKNRMLLEDVDPSFGDFLRAGAARVVFPVRPGFEAAVVHYLETSEIWSGGEPPNISDSLYVPIVREIEAASGAPGNETAVGQAWEIRLPTTLVRLRPNDDLPTWEKTGEVWRATN